jgi:CRP/FNR family transcriptional regulator, cyclic AMP receptor protein
VDEALIQEVFRRTDDHRSFKPGEAIFREGEPGSQMFILVQGIVEVQVGNSIIGAFEPIEIFGEMAVIDAGPRSASVIAKTDCKLIAVNQSRFFFAIHIMSMLVERIRWMNSNTASLPQVEPAPSNPGPASGTAAAPTPGPNTPVA